MTIDPHAQPGGFSARNAISEEEVLALRRHVWADGRVSLEEAGRLFDLNDGAGPSNEWSDFFIEAIYDYLIARGQPRGYVTEADAQWLVERISRDGRVESHAELELIVKLLERADSVPESLKHFALRAIEQTVLTGEGPTRRGGEICPGRIDSAEAALLRRLIFAPAGDGPAKGSASEAEMLFRLKDATLRADNCAEWPKLFVQGVANHLMAYQGFAPLSPEEAARIERPYARDPFGHILARLGRERSPISEAMRATFDDEHARIAAHDRAVAFDAEVTPEESAWLSRLIESDGARDALEQALVDFLIQDGAHPL